MIKSLFKLISYGLDKAMIDPLDVDYTLNRLAYHLTLSIEPFTYTHYGSLEEILDTLLSFAVKEGLISDSTEEKDNFESLLLDSLTPRPSTLQTTFDTLSSASATDYFYTLCKDNNYIKTTRLKKNIHGVYHSVYGAIDITINLSKPEKDPALIAKLKDTQSSTYPQCLLCKENVGYYGTLKHPGRSNHRTIKMMLNNEPFHFQYSPYSYYNEHAIVLHEAHIPMEIGAHTFERLFDFVTRFSHYFLGSNAGLPIVGGSILDHEHYQGGRADFPVHHAEVFKRYTHDNVTFELLHWPLSVVRLISTSREAITKHANSFHAFYEGYSDETVDLISHTTEKHNAITPIAQFKDNTYILTIALRNNRTSDTYPDGIFHPHKDIHPIKKENIGLIEVMGLAILPGRLEQDLKKLKEVIEGKALLDESLSRYKDWIKTIKLNDFTSTDEAIDEAVGRTFVKGLEDCGVFKQNQVGRDRFIALMEAYFNA